MKAFLLTALCALILTGTLLFSQCKKDRQPTNINFSDEPLSVIRSNIMGNWKLQYGKGGVCAICVSDWRNSDYFWDLSANDHIRITYNGKLQTDTTIVWAYDNKLSPQTYVMSIGSRGPQYIIDGVVNDTLVLHDAYVADYLHYYFTKRN